jgi:hypothetical protein
VSAKERKILDIRHLRVLALGQFVPLDPTHAPTENPRIFSF